MNKYYWLLLAAFCGALASLEVERRNGKIIRTPFQKMTFVLCGVAFSFFVTPLISSLWNLVDPGQIGAIGFLIAMGWQNLYTRFARGVDEARLPFEREPSEVVEIIRKKEEEKEGAE